MLDFSLRGRRRVPHVIASELNECGLACLSAISGYYRGEHGLPELRRLANPSGRGETLLDLRDLAERMGLAARGLKLDVETLGQLSTPAILHWDMNHFVVLERVTRHGLVIMDPAAGRLSVPWKEVTDAFTGVALEVTPTPAWQRRSRQPRTASLRMLISPWSRWRTDIGLILTLSVLMELLVLVAPLQMQMSIDHAVRAGDGRLVWVLAAGFGLIALIQGAVSVVRAWATEVFGTRVTFELMDRFVRSLHAKPARFFLKHHTADLLSRARSVDAIQQLVTARLIQVVLDTMMSIAMLAMMFFAAPVLGAVVASFGLLNIAVTAGLKHAAIDVSRRSLRAGAKADALFLENARAARAIRLFGKEQVRIAVWRNRYVELTNLHLTDGRLTMYAAQAAQLTASLGNVALIGAGAYLVVNGDLTLGTMMMVVLLRSFFVERLNNCVTYLMDLRRVRSHAERIDEVMREDDEALGGTVQSSVATAALVRPAADSGMRIDVRGVWFRYGDDSPWILQGASLTIEPRESVAITGASGCGKTTLLGVMLGLLEPARGEVLVNGVNLKSIAPHDYARLIGVVMQDDILFHGTVADNISFFDAPVDLARVADAARKAHVAADIEAMPMGYYSMLAEGATDMSGGQKQRLFIARAIYHAPQVLFLDEATSHLDSASERSVSDAVRAMQVTRVLIAHRQETIATADRVLVLDGGTLRPR